MTDAAPTKTRAASAALFFLFFISGLASLVYQTVWIRKFSLILGGTTYSMSVVISTFMAGLALGAAGVGRLADRARRPLLLYAGLELAIGACAVVLEFTDGARERMARALIDTTALEGTVLLRVLIVLLWLGLPCFLIGGTLPVMVKFVVRQLSTLGQQVGALYFVNTLGAATGALLTGYLLVEWLGLSGATFFAVGINVVVASLALWVERQGRDAPAASEAAAPEAPVSGQASAMVLPALAFFVSGFCALVLEMSWTRLLLGFLQSGVLVISINLFVVLLGFAVGGMAISRLADRSERPVMMAAILFGCTALVTVLSLGSIEILPGYEGVDRYHPSALELTAVTALILPAALCMGATFPVLVRVLVTDKARLGSQLGGYYALNTVGTVLGGVAAPFFLIPRLGTASTVFVAVFLQLAMSVLLGLTAWSRAPARARAAVLGLVASTAALVPMHLDLYHRALTAVARARYPHLSEERAYVEGPDSTVILFESDGNPAGRTDTNRFRIQVNASPEVAFDTRETKLMAHLPLLAVPEPKRALVICFGMGNTFRSALSHDIDVDVADINGAIPPLARIHQAEPARTFDDPRGHIVINDGRNFLLLTSNRYDMITIDPAPPVWTVGLGNIQSKEFYQLMSDRLTDEGVAEAWMVAGLAGDFEVTLAAFRSVFPHVAVFWGAKYHAFHVLGSRAPIRFSKARLQSLLLRPRLVEDLGADLGYFTEGKLAQLYITDEQGVDQLLAGVEPLTDGHPLLEYRARRGLEVKWFEFPKNLYRKLEFAP